MKKTICLLLACLLIFSFASCAKKAEDPLKLGVLIGPSGMGACRLLDEDYAKTYSVSLSSAPDEITAKFISGEIDAAAVPINLASVLYQKLEGNVRLAAIDTLGVLYILDSSDSVHSFADLAGKTLYATGQGSTPEYILNYLLEKNGIEGQVTVEYKAEHSELAALLASGEVSLGMLPEPNVTAAHAKNQTLRVALDLTEEWSSVCQTQLVQGVLIVRADYAQAHAEATNALLKDFGESVSFVNESPDEASAKLEEYGILPSAAIAKQAIDRCNIVCITGEEMKTAAAGMLQVLFDANPKSVGGALPENDFYYMG